MAEYWALPYQIWLIWGFIRIYNEKPISALVHFILSVSATSLPTETLHGAEWFS